MLGSIFSQGDQSRQALKSFTRAKIASGGAAIAIDRRTRNVDGRVATRMTNNTITTATPIRTFVIIAAPDAFLSSVFLCRRARRAVNVSLPPPPARGSASRSRSSGVNSAPKSSASNTCRISISDSPLASGWGSA